VTDDPPGCFLSLTGVGMRYNLLCERCADTAGPGDPLLEVCEGCIERAEEWSSVRGWRGAPEVRLHDGHLEGTWETRECSVHPANDRCVAALPTGWLVLTPDGLAEIDGDGDVRRIGPVELPTEPANTWAGRVPGPALHASRDGRFAGVVRDYGRHGVVVDVGSGKPVVALDRGAYHPETTPFPIAFIGTGTATVVVAATDWNRLDVFDAATGRLLTGRETDWAKDAERPEHYLDYFHGGLSVSPSGARLLDDGWVWHPVGVPKVIDVHAWLSGDTFAAEHGDDLTYRDYAWDQPVAWLDERTVAIQRIGFDDEAMIDGVQIFDVVASKRIGIFAGPVGPTWAHDNRLYVNNGGGLEIWDPIEGARTGFLEGFRPTAQDPATGTLAEIAGGTLRTWRPAPTRPSDRPHGTSIPGRSSDC
jgi:hypothetical protein